MPHPFDKIDPSTSDRWIKKAKEKKSSKIIVCRDSIDKLYYPHYLSNPNDEEKVVEGIRKLNKVIGVVDVAEELSASRV